MPRLLSMLADDVVHEIDRGSRSADDTSHELKVFDTSLGGLAIDICYEIEFPLLTRARVGAGADAELWPRQHGLLARGMRRIELWGRCALQRRADNRGNGDRRAAGRTADRLVGPAAGRAPITSCGR